jgi:hypothetical protein
MCGRRNAGEDIARDGGGGGGCLIGARAYHDEVIDLLLRNLLRHLACATLNDSGQRLG